jgi:carbamoyltransferase
MTILGFYPLYPRFHDANVCLLRDGEVLFAYEEERLLRSQHAYSGPGDPVRGIFGALAKYKIHPSQVDCWAGCGFMHDHVKPWEHFFARTGLLKFIPNPKIALVRHHQAHVACSVLTSPFEKCLYISLDGGGDDGYAKIGVFDGNGFKDIHTSQNYHLANFYSFITQGIGFNEFDEGKTMGLASYGSVDESLYHKFRNIVSIGPDGLTAQMNFNAFTRSFTFAFEKYDWHIFRQHKVARPSYQIPSIPELQFMNKADVAATLQKLMEDLALEIVANALNTTHQRNLCLAGGLFHNVKLNQKIRELPEVESLHLPMAVGDPGLSLGAALFVHWSTTKKRCSQTPLSPFLGPEFINEEIENVLNAYGIAHERVASPAHCAAKHIAEGKIVGWFQGRGEYGPRALGNRSVLADPRDLNAKARVNQLLKKRDWFMPYAPSILEEFKDDYLVNAQSSPYMAMAFDVKTEKRSLIPGAVHVDGTCRPQTVSKAWSPLYHELISEFYKLTNIPVVLNTSFNQHGEAMVATPQNAVEHLLRGAVDVLIIGNFEVFRRLEEREEQSVRIISEEEHLRFLKIEPAISALKSGNKDNAKKLLQAALGSGGNMLDEVMDSFLKLEKNGGDTVRSYVEIIDRLAASHSRVEETI